MSEERFVASLSAGFSFPHGMLMELMTYPGFFFSSPNRWTPASQRECYWEY